jgi:hypothetical protein
LKLRKSEKIAIAELPLQSNIALKSCGIAIAEVFPSSCGIAIADSKKSCACPLLAFTIFCRLSRLEGWVGGFERKKVKQNRSN